MPPEEVGLLNTGYSFHILIALYVVSFFMCNFSLVCSFTPTNH
jgi:hypothetical protein